MPAAPGQPTRANRHLSPVHPGLTATPHMAAVAAGVRDGLVCAAATLPMAIAAKHASPAVQVSSLRNQLWLPHRHCPGFARCVGGWVRVRWNCSCHRDPANDGHLCVHALQGSPAPAAALPWAAVLCTPILTSSRSKFSTKRSKGASALHSFRCSHSSFTCRSSMAAPGGDWNPRAHHVPLADECKRRALAALLHKKKAGEAQKEPG